MSDAIPRFDDWVKTAKPRRYDEDSALDLIAQHESGGRNIKQQVVPAGGGYNPSVGRVTGPSTASGPWQITNTTWRKRAPREIAQKYPTAISAPVEVQRAVAGKIFRETGFQDWAPYNASLRKAIARGEQPRSQAPAEIPKFDDWVQEQGAVTDTPAPLPPRQGRGAPAQPTQPLRRVRAGTPGRSLFGRIADRPRQPQITIADLKRSEESAPRITLADVKQREDRVRSQVQAEQRAGLEMLRTNPTSAQGRLYDPRFDVEAEVGKRIDQEIQDDKVRVMLEANRPKIDALKARIRDMAGDSHGGRLVQSVQGALATSGVQAGNLIQGLTAGRRGAGLTEEMRIAQQALAELDAEDPNKGWLAAAERALPGAAVELAKMTTLSRVPLVGRATLPGLGALSAADEGVGPATRGAIEGEIFHRGFQAMAPLSRGAKFGVGTAVPAGIAIAEGEDPKKAILSNTAFGAMALATPKPHQRRRATLTVPEPLQRKLRVSDVESQLPEGAILLNPSAVAAEGRPRIRLRGEGRETPDRISDQQITPAGEATATMAGERAPRSTRGVLPAANIDTPARTDMVVSPVEQGRLRREIPTETQPPKMTVYRGSQGTETESKTGTTFYSPNKEYAAKYGPNVRQVELDTSNFFDTRRPEHKAILDAINNERRGDYSVASIHPTDKVPFYSDEFALRSALRDRGYKFDGIVLTDWTQRGSGGIVYAKQNAPTEPQPNVETQLEGSPAQSRSPRISRSDETRLSRVPEKRGGASVAPDTAIDSVTVSPTSEGRVAQPELVTPPRHVDLQPRRQRGEGKGQFKRESAAQREERRAQVERRSAERRSSVTPQVGDASDSTIQSALSPAGVETHSTAKRILSSDYKSQILRDIGAGAVALNPTELGGIKASSVSFKRPDGTVVTVADAAFADRAPTYGSKRDGFVVTKTEPPTERRVGERRGQERRVSEMARVARPPISEGAAQAGGVSAVSKKQPWEYTREEWRKPFLEASDNRKTPEHPSHAQREALKDSARQFISERVRPDLQDIAITNAFSRGEIGKGELHRRIVEEALSEGKPVPPEVLRDYPDLQPPKPAGESPVQPPPTLAPVKSTKPLEQKPPPVKSLREQYDELTAASDRAYEEAKLANRQRNKSVYDAKTKEASRLAAEGKKILDQLPADEQQQVKSQALALMVEGFAKLGHVTPPASAKPPEPPPSTTSARKAQLPPTTSVKNEATAELRRDLELLELEGPERKSWQTTIDNALAKGLDKKAEEIAARVIKSERKEGLSDEEAAGVQHRLRELENEFEDRYRANSADPELRGLKDRIANLTRATNEGGTAPARALNFRRSAVDKEFRLINVITRMEAAKGRPLEAKELSRYEDMVRQRDVAIQQRDAALEKARTAQIQKNIDRVQRQRQRAETKEALDAEAAAIKQQIAAEFARLKSQATNVQSMAGLGNLDPEGVIARNLLRYARNRVKANVGIKAEALIDEVHGLVGDFVERRQIAELISGYKLTAPEREPENVRRLREIRSEIAQLLTKEDVAAGTRTAGAQGPSRRFVSRNEQRLKFLQAKEAELTRRIEEGDFSKPERAEPLPYTREVQRTQDRVIRLENEFKREEARAAPGHQLRNIAGVWKSWLLSSPATQAMNIGGTGAYQAFREVSRVPAAILDAVVPGQRSITAPSPTAMLESVLHAAKVGGRDAIDILKHGAPRDIAERHQYQEIDFGVRTGKKPIDNAVKAIEFAHNAVFRFMSASDRVFYQGAYKRNLIDRAMVQAKNEGAENIRARAKELENTESIQADARHDALVSTFNNSNALSERIRRARAQVVNPRALMSARGAQRLNAAENLAIDFIMPFDRTPTNVIFRIVEASPAGYLKNAGQLIGAAMRKSMTGEHRRQFMQTFGHATTGTALMALGWYLADKARGVIEVDRENVYLKIPGLPKVNLRTASPTGNILASGARMRAVHVNPKATWGDWAKPLLREPLNQPLLRSTSTLTEMARDPVRSAEKTGARYVSSLVPFSGAVRFAAEQTDTEDRRYPQNFSERVRMNIPVLRRTVPISPSPLFRDATASTDATKELRRLDITPRGATKGKEESDAEFEKRKEVVNRNIVREINKLVTTRAYLQADDKKKRELIGAIPSLVGDAYQRQNRPSREEARKKARERREAFGRRIELQ